MKSKKKKGNTNGEKNLLDKRKTIVLIATNTTICCRSANGLYCPDYQLTLA